MKPTSNKALSCAVLGHNYVKVKANLDRTTELRCRHCDIKVTTDVSGNFDHGNLSTKNIQSTLRRLFHLSLQQSKPNFS